VTAGHSLLELILSLVLLSIIAASVGSAVMFAASAVPDEDSAVVTMANDSRVIGQIAEDLALAKYVVEQTATSVTIVVADRTGDGQPDRIRYAWSGDAGDPLTYQLNDTNPVALLDAVEVFDLSTTSKTHTRTVMGEHSLEGETDIAKFEYDILASYISLSTSTRAGQRITPSLNSDVVAFKVSEIKVYGNKYDYDADVDAPEQPAVAIEVRPYKSPTGPGATIYTTAHLQRQHMKGSMEMAVIQNSHPMVAGQDIALVCYRDPSTSLRTRIAYNTNLAGGLLSSTDGGNSWSVSALGSLLYKIRAIPTKQQHGFTLNRSCLTTAQISLQSSSPDRSPLIRRVRLLAAPEQLAAFWDTDFVGDPTTMNLNDDETSDWSYASGAFPADSISDGEWTAERMLRAQPTNPFTQMTVADIRLRSETGEGPLVYGPNRLHDTGKMKDPYALITQLRQDGTGGQELLFYNELRPVTPIARINGLPQGWIDLRLILLPDEQLVSIHVNGQEAGTLKLDKVSDDFPTYTFALGTMGSDAYFDSARVRVGGSYTDLGQPAPIGGYALELLK
jgi:hypothetical protein